ncbi:HAE1 family hydrophobic/amphiphilic exporter-1 [Natronospira proteinivora]|uniref:HAE1 family hydrophobic/amphiphilic exporter-1 n=1 Tax=Natronospira proteinivora TaxID=1807133 RepID=A0ABT1G8R5_9GAMM|nr:efflux RND transporter permease subunit [Natronospira proteinivora]MCP1727709.1 HAE1 family hydrophobic/amphiphilic exporter-1 [Natronospira proteinivora]
MNLTRLALSRPVTTFMLCASVLVAGLAAARMLPLALLPDLDFPGVFVQVEAPGMGPEELEREVLRPIEESVATLKGIDRLEGTANPDQGQVRIFFQWGDEMGPRNLEVQARIDAIRHELPDSVQRVRVFTGSTSDNPMLTLRLSSDRDLSREYSLLDRHLRARLERIEGVSQVQLYGIQQPQIEIQLDPDRLAAFGLSGQDVANTIDRNHQTVSGGMLDVSPRRLRVRPDAEFHSTEELAQLPLGNGVRLNDVADIHETTPPLRLVRLLDREPSVGLNILRESGANLVAVADRVKAELDDIRQDPQFSGIRIFEMNDESAAVTESLKQLLLAGFIGALLALAVLWFFLRSFRTTLIVVATIPAAMATSLAVMYLLGLSLNILSMMGLMLAVGMLVDNAVVVSENIFRHRQEKHRNPLSASLRGSKEVGVAVFAGTLTTIIVFLPLVFGGQDDITVFLQHVAAAIVVTLIASLLISLTLIPLLLSRVSADQAAENRPNPVAGLARIYGRGLQWSLNRPRLTLLFGVLAMASILIPTNLVESEMFPQQDSRTLWLSYHVDGSHPLSDMREAVDTIEAYLYANQDDFDLDSVYSFYESGRAQSALILNTGDDAQLTAAQVRERVMENLPDIVIGNPSFDWQRSGSTETLNLRIEGERYEEMLPMARELAEQLSLLEGITRARPVIESRAQELQVRVRRDASEQFDIRPREIATSVSLALQGQGLRPLRGDVDDTELRVIYREAERRSLEQLAGMTISMANGERVRLDSLADLEIAEQAAAIQRRDRRTAVDIEFDLAADTNTSQAQSQIRSAMADVTLPAGYRWSFGRGFEQDQESMQRMLQNIMLSIFLIYIVMAALFEALLKPLAILSAIAFSITGVYWFFLFTGTSFTFMAMIGILILMGVVVNNGIVLVNHVNHLRWQGLNMYDALYHGSLHRFRPILMTVATTILALLPLALGDASLAGDGPSYQPMARAVIGGLAFSTVVSLFLLPSLYILLDRLGVRARRQWQRAGRVVGLPTAKTGMHYDGGSPLQREKI